MQSKPLSTDVINMITTFRLEQTQLCSKPKESTAVITNLTFKASQRSTDASTLVTISLASRSVVIRIYTVQSFC